VTKNEHFLPMAFAIALTVACGGKAGVPSGRQQEPCPPSAQAVVPPSCGGFVLGVTGHPEPVRVLTPPGAVVLSAARRTLVVEAIVDPEGQAHLERVLRGPCDETSETAIRAALEEARLQPASLDGQPVCTRYALTLRANDG
jgi:hypothetical protein